MLRVEGGGWTARRLPCIPPRATSQSQATRAIRKKLEEHSAGCGGVGSESVHMMVDGGAQHGMAHLVLTICGEYPKLQQFFDECWALGRAAARFKSGWPSSRR
jgi:hypothetical protein